MGMVAVDDVTIDYVRGRPMAPAGRALGARRCRLARAAQRCRCGVRSRGGARCAAVAAAGDLGHLAGDGRAGDGAGPGSGAAIDSAIAAHATQRALEYMGLEGACRSPIFPRPRVYRLLHQLAHRGSARSRGRGARAARRRQSSRRWWCRAPARSKRRPRPRAWTGVSRRRPGVARAGLFHVPGDECRQARRGEHCASTSNRNFEGRQGFGGRTHLVSPGDGRGRGDCRALCRCTRHESLPQGEQA
jgi:3-isopropylmalate/(R)-2-methylmalate dehydratase large subunit